MSGIMSRRRITGHRGGGGGGCGVVLPTIYDDNFDCGSTLDTTGARFSGAQAWTKITGGYIADNLTGGEWAVETTSTGSGFNPTVATQPIPSGDWTIETSFHQAINGTNPGDAFWEMIGLYLGETSSGIALMFGAGQRSISGGWHYGFFVQTTNAGTAASVAQDTTWTATHVYDATLRIRRILDTGTGVVNLNFDYSLDNGSSWTTLYTVPQTTRFTTAPTVWGCAKQNAGVNVGFNWGYFRYFKRTA